MLGHYDEDLQDNTFYKEILNHHPDIIDKVAEGWILCIPREGTTTTSITIDDILDHVLIPDIELPASHYSTLSKKRLVVQNKVITPKSYSLCQNTIHILFEETFYNTDRNRYIVWCIDQPLNGKTCCDQTNGFCTLVTLQDCIEFLCINGGDTVLSHVHLLCQNFVVENPDFITCTAALQKQLIKKLFEQCTEEYTKNASCRNEKLFRLAIETCMQSYLRNTISSAIAACVAEEEAEFNKTVQNLTDVEQRDLGISTVIGDRVFRAKCELNKINRYPTILGKLSCLRNTFDILSQSTSQYNCFTSDDFLQILVYLILKLQLNNWIASLKYITEFRFTTWDVSDENSFLIASLEAAVLYIKNGLIFEDVNKRPDDALGALVRNSELEQIERLIEKSGSEGGSLCHPLCLCNKCEGFLEKGSTLVNEKGQTLLHVAVLLNKIDVLEFLVEKRCDVNAKDNFGETPLHYAAKKGYQNVILFLMQSGANVEEVNADGNTALHAAVNCGHERSVKALIYSAKSINVNASNNWGNTPLHLASKWGYLPIMNTLREAGALVNAKNYAKLTAKDVALNYFILKALNCDSPVVPVKIPQNQATQLVLETNSHRRQTTKRHEHGVRPKTAEQQKRLDLLLKAIENNDLPLTCFYLGFPNPVSQTAVDSSRIHHPLCCCRHCQDLLDSLSLDEQKKEHCNVNTCSAEGYTPLHVAAKYGRRDILRLLLDAGATLNVKTYKSLYTPLHLACMYRQIGVVRELLTCGECVVDVQDARGNTPLFYACSKNDAEVFELLLLHGADVDMKNNDSVTVLYEAERKMHYRIVGMLKGNRKVASANVDEELFS